MIRRLLTVSFFLLVLGGDFLKWHPGRWLYRYGIRLPFVEAVYGTTAYVPARPGERWGLYLGQTGYRLKPLASKGKP